jgi:hypothetical protein
MGETLTVGLTKEQRELLLQGLRFVRSSVALEIRDPEAEFVSHRAKALREIDSLAVQLAGDQRSSRRIGEDD